MSNLHLKLSSIIMKEAEGILKVNLDSLEQELSNMIESGCKDKLSSTCYDHCYKPNADFRPENWSEMVSMCANVFSTQGRNLFGDFMKMPPQIVETYFEQTNCTIHAPKIYHQQNIAMPSKIDINRFTDGQPTQTGSIQNFHKRFPRRCATFPVVPKIESYYEKVTFESLKIGPQFRFTSSSANLIELFRQTCRRLSNLTEQRYALEANVFRTNAGTTMQSDFYVKEINSRLDRNLHFIMTTTQSEAAMIEWILSSSELHVMNYGCPGNDVVLELRDAVDCLKIQLNSFYNSKTSLDQLDIVGSLNNLMMTLRCAQSFLWSINTLMKSEEYNDDGVVQRGIFIGS